MPVYLSPGVYVEEVPGTPPIEGVGTSTAAFIGVAADNVVMPFLPDKPVDPKNPPPPPTDRYPIVAPNKPHLVTNWTQFKTQFGDFQVGNKTLAHAVFGFFNNGGTVCYVARVADPVADVSKVLPLLEAIDEVAIVAVPGVADDSVQQAVIDHCENLKDRFAILDGPETAGPTEAEIQGGSVSNSDYGAIYYPWLQVFDPVTNALTFVPPSGHVAGIYARVDAERGVHKAPANEVVRGALGLQRLVTRGEQDILNPLGVNVIRNLNGAIRVWGARTMRGSGEFKYISTRRLMNFLRESIEEGTQFAVFEPNSPPLWGRITRSVTAFLTNVWRSGALFGLTPEEAFFVKCDETTNPPDVRELGQVVTEIGVAIVKPAEFVIFRITQLTGLET